MPSDCSMICMMGVPAFFTCRELIKFVMPMADAIFKMRIIRDDTPNQYMVLLNFKSQVIRSFLLFTILCDIL